MKATLLILFSWFILIPNLSWARFCPDGVTELTESDNWDIVTSKTSIEPDDSQREFKAAIKKAIKNLPVETLGKDQVNCIDLEGITDPELIRIAFTQKLIENARTILKAKYDRQWHSIIDDALKNAKNIWLGTNSSPAVIITPGMYGYGKTHLFRDIAKALGVSNNFFPYVLSEKDVEFPSDQILKRGRAESNDPPPLEIVYLSEILRAAKIGDLAEAKLFNDAELANILKIGYEFEARENQTLTDEEREAAYQKLRDQSFAKANNFLGDGTYLEEKKNVPKIRAYFSAFRERIEIIRKARIEIEKATAIKEDVEKIPEEDRTDQQRYEIKSARVSIQEHNTIIADRKERLESLAKEMVDNHPTSVNDFDLEAPEDFVDIFMTEYNKEFEASGSVDKKLPVEEKISLNLSKFSASGLDIKHVLIVMDFNPDELLKKGIKQNGNKGPNALRAEIQKLASPEALYQAWEKVWGFDARLVSRLKLRNLQMLLPYTKEMWLDFFRNRFDLINFDLNIRKNGKFQHEVEFQVDESVIEKFGELYIDTRDGGMRPYFGNGEPILQDLLADIKGFFTTHRRTFKDQKQIVRFIIAEDTGNIQALFIPNMHGDEVSIEAQVISENELNSLDTYDSSEADDSGVQKRIQRLHQVANFIIATRILESVPKNLGSDTEFGDFMFRTEYQSIAPNSASENLRALMAVASRAALNELDQNSFASDEIVSDSRVLWSAIENILKDTMRKLELYGIQKDHLRSQQGLSSPWSDNNPLGERISAIGPNDIETDTARRRQETTNADEQEPKADDEEVKEEIAKTAKRRDYSLRRLMSRGIGAMTKAEFDKVLPNSIFSNSFFEAILDIENLESRDVSDDGYRRALAELINKASEILRSEKVLFQEVYKALEQHDSLDAYQLKNLVDQHMASQETREKVLESEAGNIANIEPQDFSQLVFTDFEVVEEEQPVTKRKSLFGRRFLKFLRASAVGLGFSLIPEMAFSQDINLSTRSLVNGVTITVSAPQTTGEVANTVRTTPVKVTYGNFSGGDFNSANRNGKAGSCKAILN